MQFSTRVTRKSHKGSEIIESFALEYTIVNKAFWNDSSFSEKRVEMPSRWAQPWINYCEYVPFKVTT